MRLGAGFARNRISSAASMASPPCLVRADGAARLRRSAAPSADNCRFAEIFSVKQNSQRLLNKALLGGARRPHCVKSHSYRRADAAPLAATNDSTGKNCRTSLNTAKWRGRPEREEYLRCVVPKTCSRRTQSHLPHADENARRVKKSSNSQKPSVRTHRDVCHC